MENANLLDGETTEELISETLNIKRGDIGYKLNIELNKENIKFQISEENLLNQLYEKILDLEGIKALHYKFSKFNSCQEFLNYIKDQIKYNFLEINKKTNNIISILLKQENIEINLFKIKASPELVIRNLYEEIFGLKGNVKNLEIKSQYLIKEKNIMNKTIGSLIKDNKNILNDIEKLKEENKMIKEENRKIKEKYKNLETFNQNYQNLDEIIENIIDEKIKNINENVKNIIEENKGLKKVNEKISKKLNELEELINKIKNNYNKNIDNIKLDNINNDLERKKGSEEIKVKRNSPFQNINFSRKNNTSNNSKKHLFDNINNDIAKKIDNKKAYKKKIINQFINKQNINENFFTERKVDNYFNDNFNKMDNFSLTNNQFKNKNNRFMTPKIDNRDFLNDNYPNF